MTTPWPALEDQIEARMQPRKTKRPGPLTDASWRVGAFLICLAVGIGFWAFLISVVPAVGFIVAFVFIIGFMRIVLSEAWRKVRRVVR